MPSLLCESCSTPCPCAAAPCVVQVDNATADLAFRITWPGSAPADEAVLKTVIVRRLLKSFRLHSFKLALHTQTDGTILALVTETVAKAARPSHGGVRRYERYLQFACGQVIPVPA